MKQGDIIGLIICLTIFGPLILGLSAAICIFMIKLLKNLWENLNRMSTKNDRMTFRKMIDSLHELKEKYYSMGQSEKGLPAGQELLNRIRALDSELKELERSIGRIHRPTGNYKNE